MIGQAIDLGIVKPGKTLFIPFASFAASTDASIATTALAVTDIEIYRDGSTTQRSSDNGITLLDTDGLDFDGLTGINGFSINLADNSDAGFYRAGSTYWVVVSEVTVDGQTVRFLAATFTIGLPGAVLNTSIASLSTQLNFTLTDGPAEDDALNLCPVYIHDAASAVQGSMGFVADYIGSTKTVILAFAPTFTIAATDSIMVMPQAKVDVYSLTSFPDSAIRLEQSARSIVTGIVISATSTEITPLVSPAPTDVDQYKDRVLVFNVDTLTTGLRGKAVRITGSAIGGVLTVESLPTTPQAADTFTIQSGAQRQTGDAFARLGAPAGASVSADIAAVKAKADLLNVGAAAGSVKADALAIDGSTSAADRLEQSARSIVTGTATPASTGTSVVTSGLDPAATVTDQFKGRVLIFRSDTGTAALRGQATRITASTAGGVLTVEQLTTVPNNDSFVIV